MKKLLALALAACLAATAAAKPNYNEARILYDHMNKVRSGTNLWDKKTLQESIKAVQEASVVVDKAEKLYGAAPSSQCTQAAIMRREYVNALHQIHLAFSGRGKATDFQMYAGLYNAAAFGEKMANCYDEVEALDPANKPRK
jgi:hypothetical protein